VQKRGQVEEGEGVGGPDGDGGAVVALGLVEAPRAVQELG
jgi:hypothetical protein